MKNTIYTCPEGENTLLKLYDEALLSLGIDFEEKYIKTRYGMTHVLIAGPETAPPVVIFQGGNTINPITLSWFLPIIKKFRVYAPDTIGHPGKSAQGRVSPQDSSFGEWTVDLLNALDLKEPMFIGPSYGAGIILRTAEMAPERIKKAVLCVPSGIASGSMLQMMRIVIPMLRYKANPNEIRLIKAVKPLATGQIDEMAKRVTGAVFRFVKLDTKMPRLASKEGLNRFKSPTMVIAGEQDLFFPASRIIPRAKEIISNIVAIESIPNMGHFPSGDNLDYLNEKIIEFLESEKV